MRLPLLAMPEALAKCSRSGTRAASAASRRPRESRRGISLIEVINLLTITSILTALAMYFVGTYIRHAKTTEALGSVQSLATQAADFYNRSDTMQPAGTTPEAAHAMRHFPLSSRVSVPPLDVIRGKRFQSNPHDWEVSPWKDLRFSIHQPQYFAYAFESDGTGLTAHAAAIAEADLNGDGKGSLYRLEVHVDDKFVAAPASVPVINEEP